MKLTTSSLLVIMAATQSVVASFCCKELPPHFLCPLPPATDLNRRLIIAGRVSPFVEARSTQVCCCAAATQDNCESFCVSDRAPYEAMHAS
ncbi:hypothetical protein BC629DRAFT_1462931 [Irpex lacteus]|nr:hypothetical protein BC629DRAFT_1462931 [Irpex lacteus]